MSDLEVDCGTLDCSEAGVGLVLEACQAVLEEGSPVHCQNQAYSAPDCVLFVAGLVEADQC